MTWDALVVGGGPAGAATGYWLAEAGHRVLVVEKKRFPARRPAATASRRARSASSTTWASPASSPGPPLRRPAVDRARRHARARVARAPRLPRLRLRGAPARPRRDGGRRGCGCGRDALDRRRGGRAAGRRRPGHRRGDPARRRDRAGAGPLRGGRRRRELALRPGARHRPRPHLPARHGDPRLLHQPVPRRAVDREPPRPARPRRQPPARLRLDLPGRRRHGERRRRAAVDVLGVEVDQHQRADGRVRRRRRRPAGASRPRRRAARRPAASCRPAGRSPPTSGRRGSSSATPPGR